MLPARPAPPTAAATGPSGCCSRAGGSGKTRAGAHFAIDKARSLPGSHGALVAATADDARKTMLSAGLQGSEGASGILAVSPPDFMPVYEPSKRTLTWPNGSVGTLYTAEEPDRLRGPAHAWCWVDELAAWQRQQDAWDMLVLGLRVGERPQACITTTPRPIPILRQLLASPAAVVTRGRTYDNRQNLSPSFFAEIIRRYEGTRLGRQEIDAELLEDVPGALWQQERIDELRRWEVPEFVRIVVAVDPAVSVGEDADETGIIVVGTAYCRCRGRSEPELHGFVIDDHSGRHTPDQWARIVCTLLRAHGGDRVIAERNQGGDLVEANLRTVDPLVPYTGVHAKRGKYLRAEPIAALYEQGRVHHLGEFRELERQQCTWDPLLSDRSPDRVDALVYAITELLIDGLCVGGVIDYDGGRRRI